MLQLGLMLVACLGLAVVLQVSGRPGASRRVLVIEAVVIAGVVGLVVFGLLFGD